MSKPVAVLISDIHYSLPTLELADAALRQAITKANALKIPLVIAGDLHDTKANMRAECVNRMLDTFKLANERPYVLVGNHDKINEKSEGHSLNFLERYANIVDRFRHQKWGTNTHHLYLSCYFSDPEELRRHLKYCSPGSTIIMHQGIQGSDSGEYIQDHSAITKEDVQDFRVISGHYHKRQDIKIGRPRKGAVGLFSYIGNPYTTNFGEANDPDKGFQILMSDGLLEFVPTNLRKHVILETNATHLLDVSGRIERDDLVWVKVMATKEELARITKQSVKDVHLIPNDFRLTLEPTDTPATTIPEQERLTNGELLDSIIDNSPNVSAESKERLKSTWKSLIS